MLVSFTYKNGRTVQMQKRFATILSDLKKGTYSENTVDTEPTADAYLSESKSAESESKSAESESKSAESESPTKPKVPVNSDAKKLADEFKVDLSLVTGTGKDGRISKKDVENYIDDLV